MQHKLATWATADRTRRFDRLMRLITNRVWLAEAARIVLASSGAGTPGIDGMDKQRLESRLDFHLERLRATLLDGSYHPTPVKRVQRQHAEDYLLAAARGAVAQGRGIRDQAEVPEQQREDQVAQDRPEIPDQRAAPLVVGRRRKSAAGGRRHQGRQ